MAALLLALVAAFLAFVAAAWRAGTTGARRWTVLGAACGILVIVLGVLTALLAVALLAPALVVAVCVVVAGMVGGVPWWLARQIGRARGAGGSGGSA